MRPTLPPRCQRQVDIARHGRGEARICPRSAITGSRYCPDHAGRRGLLWLIHAYTDLGPTFFYRYIIEVSVIDHGELFWRGTWRVPSVDDPAYEFSVDISTPVEVRS